MAHACTSGSSGFINGPLSEDAKVRLSTIRRVMASAIFIVAYCVHFFLLMGVDGWIGAWMGAMGDGQICCGHSNTWMSWGATAQLSTFPDHLTAPNTRIYHGILGIRCVWVARSAAEVDTGVEKRLDMPHARRL